MTEIKIMVFRHSAFYTPLIAAIAGGFLKKEGLAGSYAVLPSGASIIDEVVSGRVDVAIVASVGDAVGPVAFSSLICRWDWLDTEEALRFTNAYRASREWTNTAEPDKIADIEADYFTDQSSVAESRAIDSYQQSGTWDGDIQIPRDLYDNALNVFEHAGLITRRHPYERVVAPPPQ